MVKNSLQGQEGRGEEIRRNFYAIDVDRRRNCYNLKIFSHLARNCRNQRIVGQERRMKYEDNSNNMNNLKEEKNLVVLN